MRRREMHKPLRSMVDKVRTAYTRCHRALSWLMEERDDYDRFARSGGVNLHVNKMPVLFLKHENDMYFMEFMSREGTLCVLGGADLDSLCASAPQRLHECEQEALRDVYEHWRERYDEAVAKELERRRRYDELQ